MIKKSKLNLVGILVVLILILSVGCNDKSKNQNLDSEKDSGVSAASVENDFVAGFYEGVSDNTETKTLTSLNLKDGGTYEFYISTLGLIDKGKYEAADNSVKFMSEITNSSETGTYSEGKITAKFSLNGALSEYSFDQVGSPDDFYKLFLGDYNSGELILSLRENKTFEITPDLMKGSFEIINGKLNLIPEGQPALSGEFDVSNKSAKLKLSVNETDKDYIFNQGSEDDNITYYGFSSKGMSGNTPVTLILKPGNRFELTTTKPRGIGVYEIVKASDGLYAITLTYTDPDKRPDGTSFTMTGSATGEDINSKDMKITIEQVEYIVDMGEGNLSTMNLGRVEFSAEEQNNAADSAKTDDSSLSDSKDEKDSSSSDTVQNDTDTGANTSDNSSTDGQNTKTDEQKEELEDNSKKDEDIPDVTGQYTTTVMGTTEVIMDLKIDGNYELGTGETGTYTVSSDKIITFTPSTEGRSSYSTVYDGDLKTFKITFSIINGTPASEYTFTKK